MDKIIKPISVKVTSQFLRFSFDELLIFDKLSDGIFSSTLSWQGVNAPNHLSTGSKSQIHEYFSSNGNRFAKVHQYSDPNNRPIGRPDPKYFLLDDVAFYT